MEGNLVITKKTKRELDPEKPRCIVGQKRRIPLLLSILYLVCLMAGCSSTRLADAFEEEQVKAAAQTVVDNLIAGAYEADIAMMSPAMQEAISAEALAANMEMMNGKTGAFKEYKSVAAVGQKSAQGGDMAVVVIVAAFEKGNVTYTISFNADMEVEGLWMK